MKTKMMAHLVEEGAAFEHMRNGDAAPMANGDAAGSEHFPVIVIGAGQAGLSTGYHLAKLGIRFLILEGAERIGDQWRSRWDSLKLFTPAKYDGLDGMPFPAPGHSFPTKDEMAGFLEEYAKRFKLPVRTGVRVERLTREGKRYVLFAGGKRYEADHVVVAMASYQKPVTPDYAKELAPHIAQLHSFEYRKPGQLPMGDVLIVGGGNSGAEIAIELARHGRKVFMSGRDNGAVPFRLENPVAHRFLTPIVLRGVFHRVLTTKNPLGRKARPAIISKGAPLIRVKPGDLAKVGVTRVAKTQGVKDGKPVLVDGRVLDVKAVIWCTGFHTGFSWIDLPLAEETPGEPLHDRGVVAGEPGLYFVGLHFLYSMSSTMIHGVGRDAAYTASVVAGRVLSVPVA